MSTWSIQLFFDGDCPLCGREVAWLKKRDQHDLIRATDISTPGFEPPCGLTIEKMMSRIHARLPCGEVIEGVDVFRHLYTIVGLGWWVPASRLPGVRQLLDLAYRVFARYRRPLGRRCTALTCRVRPNTKGVVSP